LLLQESDKKHRKNQTIQEVLSINADSLLLSFEQICYRLENGEVIDLPKKQKTAKSH
jgi:HrpA-like RNA helicase